MFVITKLLASEGSARRRLHLLLGGAAVLAVGAGVVAWTASRPAPVAHRVAAAPAVDAGEPALALVFVSGAVVHPGLYRLSPSARIADAIAAAGGLTRSADPGRLPDLAGPVHEGKQINVPYLRSTSRTGAATRLDINTATLDELRAIPTMPLGLADAIVDYRTQFGFIRTLSELRTMLGVDGPTVTGLRPYLFVAPVSP
ncbi:MAG TPA: SLBB domain-containing protein [Candidatus Angelobacter sp.]|nr:SLBB domain-containing protein [Candidatus Angelobacter sp.]